MTNKFQISNLKFQSAFTLVEILVAVAIFAVVTTIVSGLYIDAFRETRAANLQNQVYSDARFVMDRIADEIRNGMIDYDEYYNQNVVIPSLDAGVGISGAVDWHTYGQNYGRYYSSFYNTGSDDELGFDCNDSSPRNSRTCIPRRRTIDRNTGQNPFAGKYAGATADQEDTFCGDISYIASPSRATPTKQGLCNGNVPDLDRERVQDKLYLISAEGDQKTILAREKIGEAYALSLLRLNGADTNGDGIPDNFICAPEFQCMGGTPVGTLPLSGDMDLQGDATDPDGADNSFSKDFVPISPLRINVKALKFYVTPSENPYYAFAENDQQLQPRVTVVLTVEGENLKSITLVETVSSRVLEPIPAPLLVSP